MRCNRTFFATAVFICLTLTGCFGTSRSIEYYTLTPLQRPAGTVDGSTGTVVAILPVTIPATIDRPQIVTRMADNQIVLSEYHRWAGSIKEDIGRTIAQNINTLFEGRPVTIVPETLAVDPRYYIAITVNRLDGRAGESVFLNAAWTLRDQRAKQTLAIRSFVAEEKVAGNGYTDLVAAKSRLIEALSREIAAEIEHKTL